MPLNTFTLPAFSLSIAFWVQNVLYEISTVQSEKASTRLFTSIRENSTADIRSMSKKPGKGIDRDIWGGPEGVQTLHVRGRRRAIKICIDVTCDRHENPPAVRKIPVQTFSCQDSSLSLWATIPYTGGKFNLRRGSSCTRFVTRFQSRMSLIRCRMEWDVG